MKELEIFFTPGIQSLLIPSLLIKCVEQLKIIFERYRVDMFVFENDEDGNASIRLAGYYFESDLLDEETIVYTDAYPLPDRFWCKIDDYGDKYVGTFLLPDEY